MSYGLRGCDGRVHGLGIFDPGPQPSYEDCGMPPDSACVARNNAKSNAYVLAISQAQAVNNQDQCEANAQNANSPEQYAAVMARCAGQFAIQDSPDPVAALAAAIRQSPPPVQWTSRDPAPRGGQLTFSSSRGGTSLQVGDSWMVAITGASPNSPVTVSGSMPGSQFQSSPMGSTDGNGNFSKSGQVGTGEIGSWSEQWAVGGVPSGSFSFTVSAAPASQVIFTKGGAAAGAPAGGSTGGLTLPTVGGFDLSKVPIWGWAIAAGAAFFMFGGARGR